MRKPSNKWIKVVCVVALLSPTAGCESITSILSSISPPPIVGVSLGVGSLIGFLIADNAPIEASVQKTCYLNGETIDCSEVPK